MNIAGLQFVEARPISGGDICDAYRATTSDGRVVFVKTRTGAPEGFFEAEAAGLELLRVPGGPPVPTVVAVGADGLALEWVESTSPSVEAARGFGVALAALHATSMASFGAPYDGFIGSLPLLNAAATDWPAFYVEQRIQPYVNSLTGEQRQSLEDVCEHIEELCGPVEPPARIHGDLWSGNLLWGRDGHVWLVDAASAHGGHRETDLAMLAWFGAPYLEEIVAAYDERFPLAAGWRERVRLHQLHPMLVHATLFGGGYAQAAADAARSMLRLLRYP